MTNEHCFILRTLLGDQLSEEECNFFKQLGTIRELSDGEVLIKEGEVDDCLHIILSGNLAVTRQAAGGDFVNLHVLRRGDLAGGLGFIDGLEHSATLRSVGSCSVFILHRNRFDPLIEGNPKLVFNLMKAIVRGVHGTLRRMNQQQVELSNYINHQHGRY